MNTPQNRLIDRGIVHDDDDAPLPLCKKCQVGLMTEKPKVDSNGRKTWEHVECDSCGHFEPEEAQ